MCTLFTADTFSVYVCLVPKTVPLSERLWSKVCILGADDCWEWRGSLDKAGYGRIMVGGRKGRPHSAHRVAWALHHGREVPAGLHVMHECDNPPCCNPAHLRLGTRLDNMRDCAQKGRYRNQRKTHCSQGHPLSGENLYLTTKGHRICRACRRAATDAAYAKRKASNHALGLNVRGVAYRTAKRRERYS